MNPAQRSLDIRAYWANITHAWPPRVANSISTNLRVVRLEAVNEVERLAYITLSPSFSQFSMMTIIMWHINNSPNNTGLGPFGAGTPANPHPRGPSDDVENLSGGIWHYVPTLIVTLLRTLRANPAVANNISGNSAAAQNEVQARYRIEHRGLREMVRHELLQIYPVASPEHWIVHAMTG